MLSSYHSIKKQLVQTRNLQRGMDWPQQGSLSLFNDRVFRTYKTLGNYEYDLIVCEDVFRYKVYFLRPTEGKWVCVTLKVIGDFSDVCG